MKKIELLQKQINYIGFMPLRKLVTDYFEKAVPEYFFVIPASSSGKYHPEQDLGVGGLVRHTQMCVEVAKELFNLDMWSRLREVKDCLIAALLIHDTVKNGFDAKMQYTAHEHPILAADHFLEFAKKENSYDFMSAEINLICDCVKSHMGQWNTNQYSKVTLPLPVLATQKFVHLCDYIASRKFIGNLDKY